MKFVIAVSFLLVIVTAEILEPTTQNLNKENSPLIPQGALNDAPLEITPNLPEEEPAPAELQGKIGRQQRHVLLKSEVPTFLVPTVEIPQFYILVDQARYAPWYHPLLQANEKSESSEKTKTQ